MRFQIVCVLINAFNTPTIFDTSDDIERDQKMKDRLFKYNEFYETVKNRALDSRADLRWQDVTDE